MLLAYMTAMIAVVTFIPFAFTVPKTIQFTLRGNLFDVLINIVLFVPLGFFFQTIHGHAGWKSLIGALCFGLAVSCIVEAGQLFLPSRYSSLIDMITNGMGALLGSAIAVYHQRLVRNGRIPELLGFGLPLISSVYLLVPLLWLGGISMGHEISRLGLMALVGVHGGGVISSAVVNRAENRIRWPGLAVFGITTCWFMIGAAPALPHFPLATAAVGCTVGVAARLSGPFWKKKDTTERRFELPTLKRLLPIYLFYLLLVTVWPTTVPLSEWSLRGEFQLLDQAKRVLFISRFVEVIAAFTLLGYLLAEISGRKRESGLTSLKRVLLYVMGIAICITTLHNVLVKPLYIFVETAILTIAAMYGAIVYRLQLAVVKKYGEKKKNIGNRPPAVGR